MTVLAQPGCHFQHAVKWRSRVLLIEQSHQEQVLGALPSRLVIEARAGKSDQFALTAEADRIVVRLDQLSLLISRADQLFFEPVELNFELADLLVEFRFESFFFLGAAFSPGREDIRQTLDGLLFPLRHEIRVTAVVSGDFIDRALPLDRLKCDLYLKGGGVGFSLLLFHRIAMMGSDFTPQSAV
jgi:hypothetical protein